MRPTLVALLVVAAAVTAAPAKNKCDLKTVAAQKGLDEECLTQAENTNKKLPAPCNGCAKKLHIEGAADAAKKAASSAKNAVEDPMSYLVFENFGTAPSRRRTHFSGFHAVLTSLIGLLASGTHPDVCWKKGH
ncbi:hypothetical protein C8R47DRAFT_1072283 [Mycena vitilis]|nr:hypothetical protein C8R47DRAFT_1072283 [Mycena vitilis]